MKVIVLSVLASLLVFLSSLKESSTTVSDRFASLPDFKIENSRGTSLLGAQGSKYLIVSFWDPTDAASRIANSHIDRHFRPGGDVRFISINTGSDTTLADAVRKIDGLNPDCQYNLANQTDAPEIFAYYSLSTGNRIFIIGPDGKIRRINPTAEEIDSLLSHAAAKNAGI